MTVAVLDDDTDRGGIAVLGDVRESLLNDPVDCGLGFRRQSSGPRIREMESDGNTHTLRPTPNQLLDCGVQSEVVKRCRTQIEGQVVSLAAQAIDWSPGARAAVAAQSSPREGLIPGPSSRA